MVNSTQGGGSKDTWVLTSPAPPPAADAAPAGCRRRCRRRRRTPARPPSRRQQQQQQRFQRSSQEHAGGSRSRSTAESGASPMLSRTAESLFWIGRYVERAEDTARHAGRAPPPVASWTRRRRAPRPAGRCSTVMGLRRRPTAQADVRRGARPARVRPGQPGSIAGSLAAARENARGVRESLSRRDLGVPQRHPPGAAAAESRRPGGSARHRSSYVRRPRGHVLRVRRRRR